MFIEIHKRETGIPSNRGSRHGECVNKLVHTARTLLEWVRNEDDKILLEAYNITHFYFIG